MEDLVTCSTILNWLKEQVEKKIPISPSLFLDAASKLNVLISDEHDALYFYQQKVAQLKVDYLKDGDSAAKAKIKSEATEDYRRMMTQRARIEQIEEAIRISKIRARLTDSEIKNY